MPCRERRDYADLTVRRFIAIAETCDERVALRDVARRLGTSTRSLTSYVSDRLGISPARYMRQRRLLRARALLLAGEGVTRAAYEIGFWNLGIFARYYRAEFGELPNETLQRRHRS